MSLAWGSTLGNGSWNACIARSLVPKLAICLIPKKKGICVEHLVTHHLAHQVAAFQ